MRDFDFDQHFENIERRVSIQFWIASITRLVWAIGCIAIVGAGLWLVGHLAGGW